MSDNKDNRVHSTSSESIKRYRLSARKLSRTKKAIARRSKNKCTDEQSVAQSIDGDTGHEKNLNVMMVNTDSDEPAFTPVLRKAKKIRSRENNEMHSVPNGYQVMQGTSESQDVRVVRGSMHQGAPCFSAQRRGKQCTAMAAAALVMRVAKEPGTWVRETVDQVLEIGDVLYGRSLQSRPTVAAGESNPEYLTPTDLCSDVAIARDIMYEIKFGDCFYGHLYHDYGEDGLPNLKRLLQECFPCNTSAILTCNAVSVAVFKTEDGSVWMFDSHSRGPRGEVAPDGKACLIGLGSNVAQLHDKLLQNLPKSCATNHYGNQYMWTIINVQENNKILQTCIDLRNATILGEKRTSDGTVEVPLTTANVSNNNTAAVFIEEGLAAVCIEEEEVAAEIPHRDAELDDDQSRASDNNARIISESTDGSTEDQWELVSSDAPLNEGLQNIQDADKGIFDFPHLWKELHRHFDDHSRLYSCNFSNLKYTKCCRRGLIRYLTFTCEMCSYSATICSEPKDDKILSSNSGVVLGATCIGIGLSQMEQLFAALNIKSMSYPTYKNYHDEVFEGLVKSATEEMRKAGEEERRLAIDRGHVINGIPFTRVVGDGSWMKRSYKGGKYDSPSGIGVLVGYYTRKVLFIGIRNKMCGTCDYAASMNKPIKDHVCYKNWGSQQSSTSMESDAILEGFNNSIEQHGLIYAEFVADGDSSVYKNIVDHNPYREYDVDVIKIECTNHLIRSFANKIKEISRSKGHLGSLRKKIEHSTKNFGLVIRASIQQILGMEEMSWEEKLEKLTSDICHISYHVFGSHDMCADSGYGCNGVPQANEENLVPMLEEKNLFEAVQDATSRLKFNVESLLHNVNNNNAETYNAIVVKCTGAKRINFGKRNSYNARCNAAVLSFNREETVAPYCEATDIEIPNIGKELDERKKRLNILRAIRRRVGKETNAVRARSPKQTHPTIDKDYGPNAQQPDLEVVNSDMYDRQVSEHLTKMIKMQIDRKNIEEGTRLQAQCSNWRGKRRNFLTASMFGKVCNSRPYTSCAGIVKSILYPTSLKNIPAIQWGITNEPRAIEELKAIGYDVRPCGLFIDALLPGLAATPDGLVGEDGIVEIKCPYAAREMDAEDAICDKSVAIHRAFISTDSGMIMNPKHEYHYQVQGQLHITQKRYCLFMVWTPKTSFILEVHRDDRFWNEHMEQKLFKFYWYCLVPEIVDSRRNRNMTIRDPDYIIEAQNERHCRLRNVTAADTGGLQQ